MMPKLPSFMYMLYEGNPTHASALTNPLLVNHSDDAQVCVTSIVPSRPLCPLYLIRCSPKTHRVSNCVGEVNKFQISKFRIMQPGVKSTENRGMKLEFRNLEIPALYHERNQSWTGDPMPTVRGRIVLAIRVAAVPPLSMCCSILRCPSLLWGVSFPSPIPEENERGKKRKKRLRGGLLQKTTCLCPAVGRW